LPGPAGSRPGDRPGPGLHPAQILQQASGTAGPGNRGYHRGGAHPADYRRRRCLWREPERHAAGRLSGSDAVRAGYWPAHTVPGGGRSAHGSGFQHGIPGHRLGPGRSATRSARSGQRDGPGAYRYGDRRWRDDRLPRQRQLLLGGRPVQPDEDCHGVSGADYGHPDPGCGGYAHRVAAQPGAAVMKVVIAPDSFKESMSAERVALAIAEGWREVFAEADIRLCPMADGGEGTVEAVLSATGGERREQQVCGPLGTPVTAHWGWLPDVRQAVIEMAAASGLHWVAADQRDARVTTTYGTGELVLAALEAGARRIILGIGGSATNDGGAGLLEALGARLLNEEGQPIDRGGAALTDLQRIDLAGLDTRLAATEIII